MIDSMLFAVDVPAGAYTAGQQLALSVIRGPSVVRDGYGTAVMKQALIFSSSTAISKGTSVSIKNANWNDSMKNYLVSANGNQQLTLLAKTSVVIQKCGDVVLQPNSAFDVVLTIGEAVTTTVDTSVFALIDIDYPSVQAVANPANEKGTPVTILRSDSITATAHGAAASMVWTSVNVDEFKAGYRYLLAQVGTVDDSNQIGFVAFSGAASMNGLVRIIPTVPKTAAASRLELDYSTPLVKGPMNIEYAAMGTAGTVTEYLECDYIRR